MVHMVQNKNKINMWAVGFAIALFLLLITNVHLLRNWDEPVLVRQSIISIERAKILLEKGEYKEAGYILDDVGTYMWYLRNAKNTAFYDKIYFHKGIWAVCDNEFIEEHACTTNILNELEKDLCPLSDISCEELRKGD